MRILLSISLLLSLTACPGVVPTHNPTICDSTIRDTLHVIDIGGNNTVIYGGKEYMDRIEVVLDSIMATKSINQIKE